MEPKRWQDWLNVVLGAWLVVSPWILGFADQKTASLAAWILGAAVVVFAGIGVYKKEIWPEGMTIVLGLVLTGERGPVWWDDSTEFHRDLVTNTPYAKWYLNLEKTDNA